MTQQLNISFDENNIEHETINRRQSERRNTSRRKSKPLLASIETIRTLRKLGEQILIPLRAGDRRQSSRRKSRLSILSIEEIKLLRKK